MFRFARLNYSGGKKRWHLANGTRSLCGRMDFAHPRAEFREFKPEGCKPCLHCLKLAEKINAETA